MSRSKTHFRLPNEENEFVDESPIESGPVQKSYKKLILFCAIIFMIIAIYLVLSMLLDYPETAKQCWNPTISKNVEHYLVVATMIKNKRRYIREWIEFHLMMGVSYFLFYDNFSNDGVEAVIKPYVEAGRASYIMWPPKEFPKDDFRDPLLEGHFTSQLNECYANLDSKEQKVFYYLPCQRAAYDDAARRTRGKARWVGAIDVDEYFYVPEDSPFWSTHPEQPLVGAFEKLEKYNGVTVSGQHFGTSGWYSFPRRDDDSQHAQMLTKTHLRHMEYIPGPLVSASNHIKPFVNPYCVTGNEIHFWWHDFANVRNWTYKTTFYDTYDKDNAIILMNHYLWPSYIDNIEKVATNADPSTQYNTIYDRFVNKEVGSHIEYLLERLEKRIEKAVRSKPSADGHSDDWDYRLRSKRSFNQALNEEICVILWEPRHIGLVRHALSSIINYLHRVENETNYKLIVYKTDLSLRKDLENDFPIDTFVENDEDLLAQCAAEYILRISESSFARWEQWPLQRPAIKRSLELLKENKDTQILSLSDSYNSIEMWTKGKNINYRRNSVLKDSGTFLMKKDTIMTENIYELCLQLDNLCPNNRIKSLFENYQQEKLYGFEPGFSQKPE